MPDETRDNARRLAQRVRYPVTAILKRGALKTIGASGLTERPARPVLRAIFDSVLPYYYLFAILKEMRDHTYLGEFELMILLTIIRLGDDVYGVPLARELSALRGGDVSVGTVYAALDRLELKGLIASTLGDPSPERGGRAKRYFRVTEKGLQSLRETRKVLSKLWKSLPAGGEIA